MQRMRQSEYKAKKFRYFHGEDEHKSIHPWEWLDCWFTKGYSRQLRVEDHHRFWGSEIAENPPKVDYRLGADNIMAELTRKIWIHGFCLVENTEPTPEATKEFLEKIGPIRNTHYGGFYDFVPDLALADTAYTNIALPAHTDTTYFTEPAGLQAFHCLSHDAPPDHNPDEPLGGESLLVDGFQAAIKLKREFPEAFGVLQRAQIPWHASGNEGIAIAPNGVYPVIEMNAANKLRRIRWNNDDRGVVHPAHAEVWYDAARKWNEIIRRESSEFWFKLTPGTIVIFDNWRVMHGRSAFKGNRRICGAYIPRDDFISRYRETNFDHERVIRHNLNQVASVNNAAHGVNDKKKRRYVRHPKSSKNAKPQDNSHPESSEKPDLETTVAATTTVIVDTLNKPDLDRTATVKRPRSLSERQRRRRRIVNTIW
ncbi:uncharacterized protein FIESC28_04257 [Fusarium coffeatum]|uniref:TauD/TfdA-like domain-containing protein n=1 Tax=Fusarium coffeatum TaxID=231269 RepID=A0A366S0V5_9HYPO|nr:uncharacterized protein FIESC28_04257 [Fusarium coffeatum]RBR22959.1 hypothetical protein FIESC28_04257 [Fusarium coffeatum]